MLFRFSSKKSECIFGKSLPSEVSAFHYKADLMAERLKVCSLHAPQYVYKIDPLDYGWCIKKMYVLQNP